MAVHNEIGQRGEDIARQYLTSKGYAILHTNWRIGRNEADIIAYQDGLLVFVEVKTRSSDNVTQPEDAVDLKKQRNYIRLANAYVLQHHCEEEVRFDIVTVVIHSTDNAEIKHIPNAYNTIG